MVILPVVWAVLELARVKIGFGLEWGIFGQPLGENLFFARSAVFGGIFTLSFLAVMINFCVFLLLENFLNRKGQKTFGQKLMNGKIIVAITVMLAIFAGLALNYDIMERKVVERKFKATKETSLNVAIISPNLKTSEAMSSDGVKHIFDLIAEATAEATTNNSNTSTTAKTLGAPNLIILPENIFPLLVIDEKTLQPLNYKTRVRVKENFDQLLEISAKHPEISFIVGLHTAENNEQVDNIGQSDNGATFQNSKRYNSAVAFEGGKIVSIYNKHNLLPFTEKSFSFLEAIHIDPMSSGKGEQAVKTQYGNFAPLICSEILISPNILSPDITPPDFDWEKPVMLAFINLSNDNIFDSKRVATYNKIITRLRAIQTGQPIIRSAKGGFSGIFDKTGREIPMQTDKNGRSGKENSEILFGNIDIP